MKTVRREKKKLVQKVKVSQETQNLNLSRNREVSQNLNQLNQNQFQKNQAHKAIKIIVAVIAAKKLPGSRISILMINKQNIKKMISIVDHEEADRKKKGDIIKNLLAIVGLLMKSSLLVLDVEIFLEIYRQAC